ncbi:MAG TPA: peptidylprolyl isomerase [Pyrinomonadaceae bacterium]|nr:peptidylprolyl isomerase [Pyrinomonadaceae bacterium]
MNLRSFYPQRLQRLAKKLRLATVIVLGAMVVACSCNTPSQSSSTTTSGIVATVDRSPISSKLYDMYLKNGRAELGLDPNTDEGRRKIDQLREAIVSELIDRTLIAQEASRRGLAIQPDQMAEAERRAITELGGEQNYDAYLAEHSLSRNEYRDIIEMQLYGEMIRSELNKGLSVSEDDIKVYYDAHQAEPAFQQNERVTAAHILIAARANLISQQLGREKGLAGEALARAVREEMERRRQRAADLRRKAAAGADFAALARQFSEDPGTRGSGGSLGTFGRGSHPASFDEATFKLKSGATSEVVQTEYGFHVIKVSAREAGRRQALTEAAPEIRRRLLAEREAKNLADWLRAARQKASIRINEPYRFGALKSEFPAM